MCGMTGWVSYDGHHKTQQGVIAKMTATMALRGPDAGGVWIDRHVALGHRRLAVIDLTGGAQPMTVEEEGRTLAALVYTGEVYNFVELRDELERLGHRFKTRSDTEVVLRGYLQWGDEVAERLNGMFAFAVWDVRRDELFLVRDRMGVKPLFYYQTADGVLFGSEPKAILANPLARLRVGKDGFREILVLAKNPERTVYAGMNEVRPGYVVRVSRDDLTKRRYWAPTAREHTDDLPRTIETVAGLLEDIVGRQIVADVPLCSLLSGGLDSSTVTAMAYRAMAEQGGRLRSFSVDFADHGASFVANDFHVAPDTPFVRDCVAHVGCAHTEVVLDSHELADPGLNRAVMQANDFPTVIAGDMFSSLYRLFQAVRTTSTVALSGESADEVFGGYPWFHDRQSIMTATFPWLAGKVGGMLSAAQVIDPDLLESLDLPAFEADSYAQAIAETPVNPDEEAFERRMREISYLHLTRFVQFLLDRKDRMSMAVGLEVRVPFCDHRLVDYVFNIPWRLKTFDGREKSILRAAARDWLPDSIIERKKSPYPATQDPDYERAVRADVAEVLENRSHPARPLLNTTALGGILRQPLGNTSSLGGRAGLERARSISAWVKDAGIALEL